MQVNLVFLKKDGTTSSFELPSTVTFVGRRQDCDFCIPLMIVSRRHCEINLDFGKITVRDLKSRNGTLVNGEAVDEAELKAGDVLQIGPVQLVVQVDGVPDDFSEYAREKPAAEEAPPAAPVEEADFDTPIEDLTSNAEFDKNQTELAGDLPEDFDFNEDFDL